VGLPTAEALLVVQEPAPALTVAVHQVVEPVAKVMVPVAPEVSPDAERVTWLPWAAAVGLVEAVKEVASLLTVNDWSTWGAAV
jgi:hypothetical protein